MNLVIKYYLRRAKRWLLGRPARKAVVRTTPDNRLKKAG